MNEVLELLPTLKQSSSNEREAAFQNLKILIDQLDLNLKEMNLLLEVLNGDEYLFWGIQEGETSKSVGRSFSILAICLILERDKGFELELGNLINSTIQYILRESDFRGKSKELGWIHCWAHLGDLLAFLGYHKGVPDDLLEMLIHSLINKLSKKTDGEFRDQEDQRLAYGINFILNRTNQDISSYLSDDFSTRSKYLEMTLKELKALRT